MRNFLRKAGYLSLSSSILFLILGILLILNPIELVRTIFYVVGGLFIIIGIIKIISYFFSKNSDNFYNYNFMYGLMYSIFGLFVIIFGGAILSFISVIIGFWIIINAIGRINLSFKLKDSGINTWILSLLIAILILVAGIYVLFVPGTLLTTLGIVLIIYSIMDIIENIIFMIHVNKI